MDINQLSNRTIFRTLAITSAYAGLLYLAWALRTQLVWIITAFFLAVALEPAVKRIARFLPHRSRGLAGIILILSILVVLAALAITLVPPLVAQSQTFLRDLPHLVERMRESDNPLLQFVSSSESLSDLDDGDQAQLLQRLSGLGGSLLDVIRGLFGGIVAVLTVLVLTLFMIIEGPRWLDVFWRFQPAARRTRRQQLAAKMAAVVTGYTNGRLIISSIAAVSSIITMTIVDVPYAVPLGIIVGLFGLLPVIGATLGAVLAVLVALVNSFSSGIVMLIFFLVYQQLENTLIQPYVDSRTVQLSPLTALISALMGISLGGILGGLLAIPAGACVQVLIKEYSGKRTSAKA